MCLLSLLGLVSFCSWLNWIAHGPSSSLALPMTVNVPHHHHSALLTKFRYGGTTPHDYSLGSLSASCSSSLDEASPQDTTRLWGSCFWWEVAIRDGTAAVMIPVSSEAETVGKERTWEHRIRVFGFFWCWYFSFFFFTDVPTDHIKNWWIAHGKQAKSHSLSPYTSCRTSSGW